MRVGVAYILLGFLACVVACLAVGLATVRACRIGLSRLESICLGYAVGAALLSTFTLAIGSLWIARRGVFLAIAALAAITCWRLAPWVRSLKPARLDSVPVFFRWLFLAAYVVYGAFYFRHALAPEISPDGGTYHLGLVNLWNHAHGLPRIVDMYAAMPQGVEMLYLFAFSIGRHSAAALMHFSFLMLLPLLMLLYGVRFGFPRGGAAVAALIVFATPLVGWDGSVAYNDVALAAVAFAAVYLLRIWLWRQDTGTLAACCLLAGFCFAIKYTGVFVLLFVVAAALWKTKFALSRPAATIALAAMALAAAPYLVRNWVWLGNPIAFFGNSIFPNPNFHVSFEHSVIEGQVHLNGITWKEIPKELTLGGPKLTENLGPIYLLAPVALVGVVWPESRFLLIAGLAVGCDYAENKGARFLLPVLPFLALAMAFVISRLPRAAPLVAGIGLLQLVLSWPAVAARLNLAKTASPGLDETSWAIALRKVPEEQYLAKLDDYTMAQMIESHVPERETVLMIQDGLPQSYTTRLLLGSWHSAYAEQAIDLLYSLENSATEGRLVWRAWFPKTEAREVRLTQTKRNEAIWTIAEIRFFDGGKRLVAAPDWHWSATPNPWDSELAGDNDEATRWRSWEPMRPRMEISVRLDRQQTIDHIEVVSGNGPWESNMKVQLRGVKGNWVEPSFQDWHEDPPLDLRRAATAAIRRRLGIRYVAINRFSWHPDLFRANAAAWGVQALLATQNWTLYRID
jgi:hypothetical protein